jgi:RimJ/RimL family protein N-acetyltransferase
MEPEFMPNDGGSSPKMKYEIKDSNIHLRPATPEDCDLVFEWRNNPEIIALGSSQKSVSSLEHSDWFGLILRSTNCRLYIILLDNYPIGQVRFENNKNDHAEISIFLITGFTGRGLGVVSINQSCRLAFTSFQEASYIVAFVRKNNVGSLRAFEKAGFQTDNTGSQRAEHLRLILSR